MNATTQGAIRHSSCVLVKENPRPQPLLRIAEAIPSEVFSGDFFSNKSASMEVRVVRRLLLIAVLLIVPATSYAQDATLSGTVKDTSVGVLPVTWRKAWENAGTLA